METNFIERLRTIAGFGVKKIFITSTHWGLIAQEIVTQHTDSLVDPLVLPNNQTFKDAFVIDGMTVINIGTEDEAEANRLNQDEARRTHFQDRRQRFISGTLH